MIRQLHISISFALVTDNMGKPLVNLTIAVTGDFGERRDIQKMKTWIQANGGTFAGDISSKVTHLICSKKHYKKNVDIGTSSSLDPDKYPPLLHLICC